MRLPPHSIDSCAEPKDINVHNEAAPHDSNAIICDINVNVSNVEINAINVHNEAAPHAEALHVNSNVEPLRVPSVGNVINVEVAMHEINTDVEHNNDGVACTVNVVRAASVVGRCEGVAMEAPLQCVESPSPNPFVTLRNGSNSGGLW
ncbi:hypothetical protein Salat_2549500 [Sesamum alatum]|uniref:Uncharacterized protein n=1 Tax=Sesamum alatum TaxID=300844 RepID=A0AAE1XTF9_9LAMI|nr:hypothetical protein Salat_2549500 [Sesamum alatum]